MSSKIALSKYADIIMGQSPKGDTCSKEMIGLPLLNGPTEFGSKYPKPSQFTNDPKKKSKRDDILFCVRGSTTGRMNYSDQEYAIGRRIAAIRGKNGYPTAFVRGVIERNLQQLLNIATGSTFPNVSRNMINDFQVENISQADAIKIAHILSTLDDKIELNRKMNQTLEEMAQALFKSWFIDFDPVHVKMGCTNDEELERAARELGISKEVLKLFPSEFEESELGMIPEGWEVKKFGDIVTPKKGKSITKKTIVEGNVPVVAGGLSPAYYHNQHNVDAPAITVSASGANAGYVSLYSENIWASDCSYINGTNSNYVFSHYVFLRSKQYEITRMQQGAAQPHIYPSHLMRLDVVDCGDYLWNYFESKLNPMFKKIAINELENQTLQKTRDTLLPKLLSGELDVSSVN